MSRDIAATQDWVSYTVGEIASPRRNALVGGPFGSDLVGRDYQETGVPVIRGQNMGVGRWVGGDFAFVSSDKAGQLSANIARPMDLVITQRGTLGQVSLVPVGQYEEYIISQSQMKITVDEQKADPVFLYYVFASPVMQSYVKSVAIQTGVPHTNLGILRQTPVRLPPLPQQRAIAHILGTLDDKIELNRRMNRTLEELARALFTSWFVDFDPVRAKAAGRQPAGMDAATAALFPDGFGPSDIGPIPAGWRVDPLSAAAEINPPRPLRRGDVAPYLDMANLPTAGPRAAKWISRPYGSGSRFRNDDTLLARITPCLENGKTGFVDFLSDGEVGWGSTEFIVLRSRAPLPPIWAYCIARHPQFREFAIQAMSGTSGRQRVPPEAIGRFKVIVPPESIASRFAEIVEPLFDVIRQYDQEARTLASTRDLLLPQLLSSEISIADANAVLLTGADEG